MTSTTPQFESLLEAVPDALVGMDTSGAIRFVNHQSEKLFGYERDDLVGRHIETLVPVSLWQVYDAHRTDYFADPRTRAIGLDLELRARHHDGREFPVNVTLSGIDTGDVLLEFAALSDTSRRKQAFDRAQRMTAIVQNCDDAIIGKTLGGTVTSWNPAAERMYGYSSKEIVGKSIDVIAPENRAGEITALLARIRSGRSVKHFETIRVRKDGTPIRVSLSISPIRSEDGVVVGASTIARDMTEARKAAELARAMLESSQDSLVSISSEGRITDANEATVRLTGVPREELIGTVFSRYFTEPEKANEIYQQMFTQGSQVEGYRLSIRHWNGTLTDVIYNARVHRDTGGDVLAVFAAARDVTKLNEALEDTQAERDRVRATVDSLLDPHMLLEAVRGGAGQIVDFVILDANPVACAYNRMEYQDMVGSRLLDLFPGHGPAGVRNLYAQVVDTGEPLVIDDFVYTHEILASQRRYDIRGARVGDGMSLTFRDVTDRYLAARMLAASQEQYRLLAENGSDVIMRLGPDRRFKWVSGSVVEVLGWQEPELVGQVIDEFIHPDDLTLFHLAGAEAASGRAANVEFRFRRPNNSYRWVASRTRIEVNAGGTPVEMVGGLVDITDRKAAEARELARLAELEQFQSLARDLERDMVALTQEIEYLKKPVNRPGRRDEH